MTTPRIRLARTLAQAADLFENDMGKHEGQWLPGSPADQETATEPLAGAWGDTPAHDAHVSVLLHVHAAAENLRAVGVALEHSDAVIPLFTLARTVLDQSCYPWYQLEPGIGITQRILRHKNAELRSEHEKLLLLGGLATADQGVIADAEERIGAIFEGAGTQGWQCEPRKGINAPYIHTDRKNKKAPGTTALAQEILPNGRLGTMAWRLGSAIAHGHSYGLASLLQTNGTNKGVVAQTDQQTAQRLAAAPLSYVELLQRVYVDYGWSRQGLAQLKTNLSAVWAEVGRITPQAAHQVPATFRS
ncbi:hypothetical protein [Streptomyces sp. NPDC046371]|uniref:hypothetical protein n=1 Tax=Streptomyces sp. NPDC046371 TaxID=3154916 RepID=UPI0033E22814